MFPWRRLVRPSEQRRAHEPHPARAPPVDRRCAERCDDRRADRHLAARCEDRPAASQHVRAADLERHRGRARHHLLDRGGAALPQDRVRRLRGGGDQRDDAARELRAAEPRLGVPAVPLRLRLEGRHDAADGLRGEHLHRLHRLCAVPSHHDGPPRLHRRGVLAICGLRRGRHAVGDLHDRGRRACGLPRRLLGPGREHLVLDRQDRAPSRVRHRRPPGGHLLVVGPAGHRLRDRDQPLPLATRDAQPRRTLPGRRRAPPAQGHPDRGARRVPGGPRVHLDGDRAGAHGGRQAPRNLGRLLPDPLARRHLVRRAALRASPAP